MADIRRLTNVNPAFYPLLGPALSRREIVKEVGNPIWDEDGKVWYVYMIGRVVAGFVAIMPRPKNKHELCSNYVFPQFRDRGIHSALLGASLGDIGDAAHVFALVPSGHTNKLAAVGFAPVARRGRFCKMERSKDV
jgi:hypothetical protein